MIGAPPQIAMPQPQQMPFPKPPPPPQVPAQKPENPMGATMAMMKFADGEMPLGLRNLFTGWSLPGSPEVIRDDPLGLSFSMGADQYL